MITRDNHLKKRIGEGPRSGEVTVQFMCSSVVMKTVHAIRQKDKR